MIHPRHPALDEVTVGYEHQRIHCVRERRLRAVLGRDMFMAFDKNRDAGTTAATSPIVRPDPSFQEVRTFLNVGDRLQRSAGADREAAVAGVSARVSYTFADATGNLGNNGSIINFQQDRT
jgi:hypothetical protein